MLGSIINSPLLYLDSAGKDEYGGGEVGRRATVRRMIRNKEAEE